MLLGETSSTTSQSEPQVSNHRVKGVPCISKSRLRFYRWYLSSSFDVCWTFGAGNIHLVLVNTLWEISGLEVGFLKTLFTEIYFSVSL